MDKENGDDDGEIPSIRKFVKGLEEIVSLAAPAIREANCILENFGNCMTSDSKDINNKLSDCAQNAIQNSKGPLKSRKLFQLIINDILDKKYKNPLAIIKKYSNDINGVQKQLSQILHCVETTMKYRNKQQQLDVKFLKTINKLKTEIVEMQVKENQPFKIQNNLKQYYKPVLGDITNHQSYEVSEINSANTLDLEIVEGLHMSSEKATKISRGKNSRNANGRNLSKMAVTKGVENRKPLKPVQRNRKQQPEECVENSGRKKTGETGVTAKRLKLSSNNENTRKNNRLNTEVKKMSETHSQDPEPMSISEGSSNSEEEPMSISDGSPDFEMMSIADGCNNEVREIKSSSLSPPSSLSSNISEGSGNDADLSSEDDLSENIKSIKSDVQEFGKIEETVAQRDFCLRGKPFRRNIR